MMVPGRVPGVGDTLGGYTLESLLGRGGMGSVYLATHDRLERKAALKVISPELAHDDEFRARFLREAQLAASLDHPNVIPIFDAGDADGVLFLAMRYVPGSNLHQLLGVRGVISPEETVHIAEQVGGALDAAHAAGLVHRDVKPANILLAESGGHVYLCDFGLAKRMSSSSTTQTGFFLGTADYCAPEQIEGRPVDARADVLLARGCRVPLPDGTAAVRSGKRVRRAPSASRGSSSACLGAPARAFPFTRSRRRHGACEAARRPVRERRRVHGRTPRGARGRDRRRSSDEGGADAARR